MLRTIFGWAVIIIITIIFGTIGCIVSFVSPDNVVKFSIRPWGKSILKFCGIGLKVEGQKKIPDESCVIMYNHQSHFDIFAYAAALPMEWKAVIKKEVLHFPFIGWVAKSAGHYFVARDKSSRDASELRKMVDNVKKGPPVVIAPEGTRSPDGNLLPFEKGGFFIAMQARVPIVPVVIRGGVDILPKHSMSINSGDMHVKILTPLDVRDFPHGKVGREKLMKTVRDMMEKALSDDKKMKAA